MNQLTKDILFYAGVFVGTFLVVFGIVTALAFAAASGMGLFDGSFYGQQ